MEARRLADDGRFGAQTVDVARGGFGTARFSLYPKPGEQTFRPVMAPDGTTAVGTQAGQGPRGKSTGEAAQGTEDKRNPALLTSSSTRNGKIATVRLDSGDFTRAVATRGYAAAVLISKRGGTNSDKLVTVKRDPGGVDP